MAVDDHGLEVLKKSGEEVTPGSKANYYLKVGPTPGHPLDINITGGNVTVNADSIISGTVDGTATGTERTFVNNRKIQLLSAHDLRKEYLWLDPGTKNQRISTITYTSASFPGVTFVRTFTYNLVSGKYVLDEENESTTPGA